MRRRLLWTLLLLAPVLFLESCKKDEDPVPAIVGTWSRTEYIFTELPKGFESYENYSLDSFGETGYTFSIKSDGTYTRAFTVSGVGKSVNDKGKWTLDGTTFKVSPDSADDLDKIESYAVVGTDFKVEGDVSDVRLVLSRVVSFSLLPDNFPDGQTPVATDYVDVDVTVLYKFNKL